MLFHLGQREQDAQGQARGHDGKGVEPLADGDPEGRHEPDAPRGGEAPDEVPDADNRPGPQETDPRDDPRRNAPWIDLNPGRRREDLRDDSHPG